MNHSKLRNDFITGVLRDSRIGKWGVAVAYCLTYHANNKTGECYPGVELMARELRVSAKSVKEGIKDLKDNGWIHVSRDKPRGHNRYMLRGNHPSSDNKALLGS